MTLLVAAPSIFPWNVETPATIKSAPIFKSSTKAVLQRTSVVPRSRVLSEEGIRLLAKEPPIVTVLPVFIARKTPALAVNEPSMTAPFTFT